MNQSLLRQPLKTYSYQFWGFRERLNGFTWIRRVYDSAQVWPLRIHPRQAGYVSGMLAPVGIGITGALLIVGALYSIRMIHRKRRNSFKHQRRKVRQPEVNTTSYYFSFTFDGGSALYWVLSVPFFFFLSNLESPEPAVRTRPCCWLTAPRTSSDETPFLGRWWPMADAPCEGGSVEHSHRYDYRIFNHPGQFGYDSSDPQSVTEYRAQFAQAAQRSALYPPPLPFYKLPTWALFWMLSGDVDCNGFGGGGVMHFDLKQKNRYIAARKSTTR